MIIDLFLWPMLLPLLIPILYCYKNKKEALNEVFIITLSMAIIVIFYWPLTTTFYSVANIYTKTVLFVIIPAGFLFLYDKSRSIKSDSYKSIFKLETFGITNKGIDKSLIFALIFTPIMIITTIIVLNLNNYGYGTDFYTGTVYFVESFTEEFLFRGILFLFLASRINIQVAYWTSLLSFILMHPQYMPDSILIITIVQGFLTLEICRRSKNMIGAWTLHGINRIFTIVILPFIL